MFNNYYIQSFFWSTLGKILVAIINFVSIPLLIGIWGEANYGILVLALACNGYLQLMDLGINTGAIRYFSIWISKNELNKLHRVANSNSIFYCGIGTLNCVTLLFIAIFCENWFNVSHYEFLILRNCLVILAVFSLPTWLNNSYNQLLIANKEITFTMKVYFFINILKGILIAITIYYKITLEWYFTFLTAILTLSIIPFYLRCKSEQLINAFQFRFDWTEFKPVLSYSVAIFMLSVFQMTATNSRPIILGIVSKNASETLAYYRIIEVMPVFILSIGGMITSILLPKSSEYLAKDNRSGIDNFAYKGTRLTSILSCILTFPIILGADYLLSAYMGEKYIFLTPWLIIWCITILIQIHTTPGNSLILALGKTKILVWTSAISCLISMIINIVLCKFIGIGSAIIGYAIYVLIVIGSYYLVYYKKLLGLNRFKMLKSFVVPVSLAVCSFIAVKISDIFFIGDLFLPMNRIGNIIKFLFVSILWGIIFFILCFLFKLIKFENHKLTF